MVAISWILDVRGNTPVVPGLLQQAPVILFLLIEHPGCVDAIIKVVGGDTSEVAKVVLEHMKEFLRSNRDDDYEAIFSEMALADALSDAKDPIREALAAQKMCSIVGLAIIVITARPFSIDNASLATFCLIACFRYLDSELHRGLTCVILAIDAGLIQGILCSDSWFSDETVASADMLTSMLSNVLPGLLAYRSVLRTVQRAMKK